MTQPTQAAPESGHPDLQGILSRIEAKLRGRLRYYDSELHGLSHLREVALLAGKIAAESGVDVETAMVAGFLHDCGRISTAGGGIRLETDGPQSDFARAVNLLRLHLPRCSI